MVLARPVVKYGRGVDVVGEIFGAVLMLGALMQFLLFVVRLPAYWVPDYGERLAERGPNLSKENANRGDFISYFYMRIFRSRVRSAIWTVLMAYAGWRFWALRCVHSARSVAMTSMAIAGGSSSS